MSELRDSINLSDDELKSLLKEFQSKSWDERLADDYVSKIKTYDNYSNIIKYFCLNNGYIDQRVKEVYGIIDYPNNIYYCLCGYKTNVKNALVAHKKYCKEYRLFNDKGIIMPFIKSDGSKVLWNKGLTKWDHESIMSQSIKQSEIAKQKIIDGTNGLYNWNCDPDSHRDSYIRQSITRKKLYASGELTPAEGVGKGKGSYIIYNNKIKFLRSIPEFIIACYFYYKNYDFDVEAIRVSDGIGTKISDFNIKDRVFEVKPFKYWVDSRTINLFKSNGYKYYILDHIIIGKIYHKLFNIIKIDNCISNIYQCRYNNSYAEHNLKELFNT